MNHNCLSVRKTPSTLESRALSVLQISCGASRARYGYEVVSATGVRISALWRENLRLMYHADRARLLRDS